MGCLSRVLDEGAFLWCFCYTGHTMNKKQLKDQYENEAKRLVNLLTKKYKPEKIILFGSMASGHLTDESDIDLLVIKDTPKDYHQRNREVTLMCASYIPKDIFVFTPAELKKSIKENRFLITEEILPKGKVLYEKK